MRLFKSHFKTSKACALLTIACLISLAPALGSLEGARAATAGQSNDSYLHGDLEAVINTPPFGSSWWGILVEDKKTGEVLYQQNPDKMFDPASVTKLYTVSSALDALGADYRFKTPIYARGEVDSSGTLRGDLILVASGDLTMGGRTTPDDKIAYTNSDHGDAPMAGVTLTSTDPLAGLNDLAEQVSASGIKRVEGDVIIDDRLFDKVPRSITGEMEITPIMINDNLIDLNITPTRPGSYAQVEWRPITEVYKVRPEVVSVPKGLPTNIDVSSSNLGIIDVKGQVETGNSSVIYTYPVEDPSSFARSLLIEALQRKSIVVDSLAYGTNPSNNLPDPGNYSKLKRVALLTSPPFSENAKLILKVSQNLHANALISIMAANNGSRRFDDGFKVVRAFLKKAGLDQDAVYMSDGNGGKDLMTPNQTLKLLRYMSSRQDFVAFRDALPILGVDGTTATQVRPDSPARGNVQAKTGTNAAFDPLNGNIIVTSKALAGYMTTASNRELAFAIYVNNAHVASEDDVLKIGDVIGHLCEILYGAF